jgi:undecaprenyl-phosphate 4-deoxy-4-formamido-L-arabinose transferase
MQDTQIEFSVVIPVYNGQGSIIDLANLVSDYFSKKNQTYEIIFVDDGSKDDSLSLLEQISSTNKHLKIIAHMQKFGQINAILNGLRIAEGKLIIVMDDDLQNAPNDIDKLINKMTEGYDYIFACPTNRPKISWRTLGSKLNDLVATKFMGKPSTITISSFFIINRKIRNYVIKYDGPYPYLAGLLFRISKNCTSVDVAYNKRKVGKSGYTLKKLVNLWANGLTNFSILPLRFATAIGISISLLGIFSGIWLTINKILGLPVQVGWTSLQVSIFFFSGIQLFCIGLLGEYVGRLFMIANKYPQSAVKLTINCDITKLEN